MTVLLASLLPTASRLHSGGGHADTHRADQRTTNTLLLFNYHCGTWAQYHSCFILRHINVTFKLFSVKSKSLNSGWMLITSMDNLQDFLPCRLLLYGRRKRGLVSTSAGISSHSNLARCSQTGT